MYLQTKSDQENHPTCRTMHIGLILLLAPLFGFAGSKGKNQNQPEVALSRTATDVMNGYRLKDYIGFEKKWHLVTVRYRRDSTEMRFTYANDLAWKALRYGSHTFPDGAIFAKIGAMTQDDPAFTSSAVPSGALRYQLMVKNAKKHADTGGWGYALFDSQGEVFKEDPKVQTKACHACHQLVPDRGYVFSEIMEISPFTKRIQDEFNNQMKSRIQYTAKLRKDLPTVIKNILPDDENTVMVVTGPMQDDLFQGTLNEIVPALLEQAYIKKTAALLISRDEKRYSLVYNDKSKRACKEKNFLSGSSYVVVSTVIAKNAEGVFETETRYICKF